MEKRILSGNEALAQGAWEAGVEVAAAYPGTPSTEILENLRLFPEIYAEWSANEKVALDVAIGAAYAGKRALAAMKHVGLNVASESLFYSAYTGVNAGLVIINADDPGLHSSQNEQDNRHYARFAKVPMLEPSDSQEAKDLVAVALDISEQFDTPVLLRTTTRTSHAKSIVTVGERKTVAQRPYQKNPPKYVMIPGFAKQRHPVVEERMQRLAEFCESFPGNRLEGGSPRLGIVASGPSYQYAREVFPEATFLKLGMVWPLPRRMLLDFAGSVERVIVVEELDPFFEEHLHSLGIPAEGKAYFPMVGEFSIEIVRRGAHAAGLVDRGPLDRKISKPALPARPPVLCAGCGHRDVFSMLRKLKVTVNSDIGCYALGVMPPLGATDTIGCMGASIGVATGMRRGDLPGANVAVIGDSTFFHAGLPALANAVYNQTPLTTIVVDNRTTGMTGHQGNPGTGLTLTRHQNPTIDIAGVARAMGVRHVSTVESTERERLEEAVREAIDSGGPAVVIAKTPCVFVSSHGRSAYRVLEEDCNGCTLCMRLGCPAIYKSATLDAKTKRPLAWIDPVACVGCGLCFDVCARQAILEGELQAARPVVEAVS
ncbi:MAG TPA: indolepyruvate ferredoxin oxidoreductase subunit alpha [Anaerolineales bacterium]|nr:indolepyruvate ferredoxin oxidoreductase subunit alpha [Anaerolineales bacterium]